MPPSLRMSSLARVRPNLANSEGGDSYQKLLEDLRSPLTTKLPFQILRNESRDWLAHLHVSKENGLARSLSPDKDAKPVCFGQPCSVDAANSEDIQRTVVDAHATFESGVWSRASANHRSKVLTRLARALEERIPALAELETLQTGRAIREMRAQLGRLPEWL